MSERPTLRVSKQAVEAARAEVAAYEAAGIVDQLDPMVRRIAEASPVGLVAEKPESVRIRVGKNKMRNVSSIAGNSSLYRRSAITARIVAGQFSAVKSQPRRVDS